MSAEERPEIPLPAAYQLLGLLEYDERTTRATLVVGTARYPLDRKR